MNKVVVHPVQWTTLDHVDDVSPLNDADAVAFSEIRDILRKHGLTKRFGVFLLHKHFDLSEGEFLFEETDEDARKQVISVKRSDNPDDNALQTMWAFSEDASVKAVTKCVRRCHYDSGHKSVHVKEGH